MMYNKMMKAMAVFAVLSTSAACSDLTKVMDNFPPVETVGTVPSTGEINQGLKSALEKGTLEGVADLAKSGGYANTPSYRIHFPPNAQKVENTLRDLGFDEEVDRLVVSLNRAAEKAVLEAKPIFINAIKNMDFQDVREILFGTDSAATIYLKQNTFSELHDKFEPHIQASLNQVNATKYWTDIMTQYNKLPFVQKINTDLSEYVTQKAINGLFKKIAEKEKAIRESPKERTTELLRKVFNYADSRE